MRRHSGTESAYSHGEHHRKSTCGTTGSPTYVSSIGEENEEEEEEHIRAMARRAWRRVSSTHSLEDLLLEESVAVQGDHGQQSPPRHNSPVLTSIFLFILGIICLLLGCIGLAACWLTVYHCYPTSTWSKASCDPTILSWYHRTVIQGGIHSIVLPILHFISVNRPLSGWIGILAFASSPVRTKHMSLIQCLFRSEHIEDLVIRQMAFIQEHYPYSYDLKLGMNQGQVSDSFLYSVTLIPIVCGPVTFMAIAVNWLDNTPVDRYLFMSRSQGIVPNEGALSLSRSNGTATAATGIAGSDGMAVVAAPLYVPKRRGRKRNNAVIEGESGSGGNNGETQKSKKGLPEVTDRGILRGTTVDPLMESNEFAADIVAGDVNSLDYFPGLEGDVEDVFDFFLKEDFDVLVDSLTDGANTSHLENFIENTHDDECLPPFDILSKEVFDMVSDDGLMNDYDHLMRDVIQDRLEQQQQEDEEEMGNRRKRNSDRKKRRGSKRKRGEKKRTVPQRRSARLSLQRHLVDGPEPSKENILITPTSGAMTREGAMERDLISTPVATPQQYIPKFYYECGAQWTRPPFRVISPTDLDKMPGAPTNSYDFLDFLPHLPDQSLLSQCEEKDDSATMKSFTVSPFLT